MKMRGQLAGKKFAQIFIDKQENTWTVKVSVQSPKTHCLCDENSCNKFRLSSFCPFACCPRNRQASSVFCIEWIPTAWKPIRNDRHNALRDIFRKTLFLKMKWGTNLHRSGHQQGYVCMHQFHSWWSLASQEICKRRGPGSAPTLPFCQHPGLCPSVNLLRNILQGVLLASSNVFLLLVNWNGVEIA